MSTYGIIASYILAFEVGVYLGLNIVKWITRLQKKLNRYEHKFYYSVSTTGFEAYTEPIEVFLERQLRVGNGTIEIK